MDVGLPDVDGREAVRIMRKNGFKAPIIMLTGHNTDSDTILGLESGANDYVTKPFRFAVLLARIRAQLRQHEASEDAVFTIGPYTFRPSSKELLNPKGNKVRLTEKETGVLRYLYRAGQRPVSRETCCKKSGATIPGSPLTRSRPTSTGCGRRSRKTPPALPSWSPKRAVTSWCRNAAPWPPRPLSQRSWLERPLRAAMLGAPEESLDLRAPLPLSTRSPGGRSGESVTGLCGWA
jgi:Response regulator receiver domain